MGKVQSSLGSRRGPSPQRWMNGYTLLLLNGQTHLAQLQGTLSILYLCEWHLLKHNSRNPYRWCPKNCWPFPRPELSSKTKIHLLEKVHPLIYVFILSLHVSRLVQSLTFHCQYLDPGVETQLDLLIHCFSNYRRGGLGSIYENLCFIYINTNIYIHMSHINMYLCMYVHLSIYLQLDIF